MHARTDPATLLRLAAQVLQSRMPTWQAQFGHDGGSYRARFEYPGVVSVADNNTGALLARSRPGRPTEVDPLHRPGH